MAKVNGVEITEPKSQAERLWFSHMKELFEEANYGVVNLSVTVKNGEVTNIKNTTESSFSVHNGR